MSTRDDAAVLGRARRRDGAKASGQHGNHTAFRVVVDGRRSGMPWSEHAERMDAEREVAKLAHIGMAARIEGAR